MRRGLFAFFLSLANVTCCLAAESPSLKTGEPDVLDARQRAIIPISAFTATGDLERLKPALNAGLDAGLSVNEIKEVLVQLYAYCGFPRSLNAINTFMEVTKAREAKGIKDKVGKEATPLPRDMDKDAYGAEVRRKLAGASQEAPPQGYQLFTPVMDVYLKEHLFADIFARDVLSYPDRELATISALAAMRGTAAQLWFHLGAAMNTGLSAGQMQDFVAVLEAKVGHQEAEGAKQVLADVMQKRQARGQPRAND